MHPAVERKLEEIDDQSLAAVVLTYDAPGVSDAGDFVEPDGRSNGVTMREWVDMCLREAKSRRIEIDELLRRQRQRTFELAKEEEWESMGFSIAKDKPWYFWPESEKWDVR